MRLGMIASPERESFRLAAEESLDFVEFCVNGADTGTELLALVPQIQQWSREYHVKVGSIGRWKTAFLAPDGEIVPQEVEIARRLLEICDRLECPNYVCGCNYAAQATKLKNYNQAVNFLGTVLEMAHTGTTVSVYNCRKTNFVCTPESWSVVLEALPELGIKFDPANSRYAGEDYLAVLAQWAHRVQHVHLKGSVMINGQPIDDPPAGLDQTDWPALLACLRRVGYDRGLSLEPHSDFWRGEKLQKGIRLSVRYFDALAVR